MSNQTIVRTEIIITSSDTDFTIPGDMTPEALVTAYSSQISGLSNMAFTSRVEERANVGTVRVVTFSPKTGTKGADERVVRTEIIITSSDTDFTIPGDMTPEALVTAYSSQISGLSNMAFTSRLEERANVGTVRVVTFSPKTGTKG